MCWVWVWVWVSGEVRELFPNLHHFLVEHGEEKHRDFVRIEREVLVRPALAMRMRVDQVLEILVHPGARG